MRGTRTLSLFCALAAAAPTPAEARTECLRGAGSASLLPGDVEWTSHDRSAVDRAKAVTLVSGGIDAGWSLDFLALRSPRIEGADCCAATGHFSGNQAGVQAWHALGDDDVMRIGAHVGKASRRGFSASVFPAKSNAGYADAGLTWEHGDRWAVSAGWYRQGGWGGRRMDLDVMRMGNGEPAAASGMRVAIRLAGGGGGETARSPLTLEAREGSRAVGAGAGMRHASDIGLTLTSIF